MSVRLYWPGVEGGTFVGALLGSLCDEEEGIKIASHSSFATSDNVRASPPTLDSITDPIYTLQQP